VENGIKTKSTDKENTLALIEENTLENTKMVNYMV
jgi:hypothetical protein